MAKYELFSWGKSMYGGWYINYFVDESYEGERFSTITSLRIFAKELGMTLRKSARLDN